jgi:ribonuclease I
MKMKLNLKSIMILIVISFMTNIILCKIDEIDENTNELKTLVESDEENLEETQLMDEFLKNNRGNEIYSFKRKDDRPGFKDPSHEYDFYLFVITWSDSYCRWQKKPARCYRQLHALNEKRIFRIHGLWPNRSDGKYLGDCNTGQQFKIPDSAAEPYVTMKQIWPSLNYNSRRNFWSHEYNKHGYCYTKRNDIATYHPFFEKTIEMYNQFSIKTLMNRAFDTTPGKQYSLKYNEIRSNFKKAIGGDYFELKCSYNKYTKEHLLDEVRLFLDMDFKPLESFSYNTNCPKSKEIKFGMEYDQEQKDQ